MPLKAQDAWIKYISLFSGHSLKLSEVINLGYTYAEAKEIFEEAIEAKEPIDINTLQSKTSPQP